MCGIKWIVYREPEAPPPVKNIREDPVLQSFGRCLEAELLTVWRRVPGRRSGSGVVSDLNDPGGGPGPGQGRNPTTPKQKDGKNEEEKNLFTQRKELWIFWYGDKPEEQFKKLVHSQLKEADISGTWENQLPYEARTLLYKALNNLIER